MIFNSLIFLIFFLIVFCAYWTLNKKLKWQNFLLLISSLVFYGWWDWRFLALIIFSSFVDYFVGLYIYKSPKKKKRKQWLLISLVSNLGLLALFKYLNFFIDSFVDFANLFGWQPGHITLNIILPVGISFYTFQTLSYSIDIYRDKLKPTKNYINFLTYVAFFPQLVAGPIERASDLLPQIEQERDFRLDWFKAGLIQIFIGLIRKIVIADNLAKYVDVVYSKPDYYNSSTLILATLFYAFQIYFDFSGYSDIAIGTAKTLGFRFNRNFDLPYFSKSMTDFWRKWHISLSSWLRDYLYISLGGNRKGIKLQYRNLLVTMLLGGLWHGSSWNFVIWGGVHGLILSVEKYFFSKNIFPFMRLKPFHYLGNLITFILVCFAWIFFRSQTFDDAISVVKGIFSFSFEALYISDISVFATIIITLFMGLVIDSYLFISKKSLETLGRGYSIIMVSLVISISILILSIFYASSNNFIYFQF